MLDGQFRHQIDSWVKPVGHSMKRAGITPDVITLVGLAMSVGCAIAIGAGALHLGLLLMVLAGVPDLLDGAVAKASGTSNPRGAFLDSVTDRVTDGLLLCGVAWYFTTLDEPGPLPVLPLAVLLSASLVSYIRAKADALGFDAHVGLIERAERFIVLGFGLLFPNLLVWTLWLLLVLNFITAGQRFVAVWRQASPEAPVRPRTRSRRRAARVGETTAADRWRARRGDARRRAQARRPRR
ncbi:MAG TPA: CDP-alcohol phosphatidyltransferase family protein [Microthrixaceae bacterium]|nr:CDP-alcohol phosphatidyltransferase family protein [Microthrixaceae bacterium]